jgi:type II secretory pathway pseudopilin PulG
MRLRRGLTLIEMMVALGMAVLILIALSGSLTVAFNWQRRQPEVRERHERITRFQDRMRSLLQTAYVAPDAEDPVAYFIGDVSSGAGEYADQIAFSAVGNPPAGAYLNDADDDFEGLNTKFGAQGGRTEYSISTVPVGSSPYESGLYVREQRPADGDPTQGGYESMLNQEVESIQFEFFDGTDWIGTWDTRNDGRRIPAAIRMTYHLAGETADRVFVVRLPHSDVTPDNPITQDTGDDAGGAAQ